MNDLLRMVGNFAATVLRPAKPALVLPVLFQGRFGLEHWSARGTLLGSYRFNNGITDVGVAHAFDAVFHAGSQITAWFIGLVDNSGYTALAGADTMASHAGWNEFTTYTEADRVAWDEGATAARSITNVTAASFAISGSGTVKGAFLVSNSTKSGTTGTLWSTGVFSNPPTVANGETLKVTYTLTG
jgi:hypothetical protein